MSSSSDEEMYSEGDESGQEIMSDEESSQGTVSDGDDSCQGLMSDESEIEDDDESCSDDNKLVTGSGGQADIEKGKAVQKQMSLYDDLLLTRIKLQKCLIAANRLPQNNNKIASLETIDNSQTVKALQQFLDTLLNLKSKFLSNNNEFMKTVDKEKTDILASKQKHKDYENILQEHHELFKPYRNETIRFWNERTKLASGKAAKSDFSAFDQPTLSQIEQIMADKNRLIERTQTKRSKYNIVGNPDSINMDVDHEIFDDDDFYHKLLRDYIEKKSADVTDPNQLGKQWLQLQKLRSKMKRKIDTRSTKGRKLRYTVHTKLINFMAPNDQSPWSEEAKQDLYNSLFGKKMVNQLN